MILLIHDNKHICRVVDTEKGVDLHINAINISNGLFKVAELYPSMTICWCHKLLETFIDKDQIQNRIVSSFIMSSFETTANYYIDDSIGFIEQSLFVNVDKSVIFPTWLMSSDIGVVPAEIVLKNKYLFRCNLPFEAVLNYLAKTGMKEGLLCYSNPKLLKEAYPKINKEAISKSALFQFIKSNYKYKWVWIYQLNQLVYNKKILLFSFLNSLLKAKVNFDFLIPELNIGESTKIKPPSIDVLIPTLGREEYLKDVLLDLSRQTLLPSRIIIIEQKVTKGAKTTLDFLNDNWPFEVVHKLIYQLGACNARNLALTMVESDWTFFADDDIRMDSDFLEKSFKSIDRYNAKAITLSCLQKGEKEKLKKVIQWKAFGTNASIVKSSYLRSIKFDMALEFGYGEDTDFGMQLRKKGVDVLYIPFVKMLHLKAPIGGFRRKTSKVWDHDSTLPKPSPTVMVSILKHSTRQQIFGYKTNLFIKFYRNQSIKNPLVYYNYMHKAWNSSLSWANKLINN